MSCEFRTVLIHVAFEIGRHKERNLGDRVFSKLYDFFQESLLGCLKFESPCSIDCACFTSHPFLSGKCYIKYLKKIVKINLFIFILQFKQVVYITL